MSHLEYKDLATIPSLVGTSNYPVWRNVVETYCLSISCLGILEGSDVEPVPRTGGTLPNPVTPLAASTTRERERTADLKDRLEGDDGRVSPDAEAEAAAYEREVLRRRAARAGSMVAPGGLSESDEKRWKEWKARESRVAGLIRGKVSGGLRMDLGLHMSAHAMWSFLASIHPMNTPEVRAQITRQLANLQLSDTSASGLEKHLESFNNLLSKAVDAEIRFVPAERAQRFLDTLGSDLAHLRTSYSMFARLTIPPGFEWQELLTLYNDEIQRRKSTRQSGDAMYAGSAGSNRGRGGNRGGTGGRGRGRGGGAKNSGDRSGGGEEAKKPQDSQAETRSCYHCGAKGHLKAECKKLDKIMEDRRKGKGSKGEETARMAQKEDGGNDDDYQLALTVEDEVQNGDSLSAFTSSTSGASAKGWVVDSGASKHIAANKLILHNIKDLDEPVRFSLANSKDHMMSYQTGESVISMDDGKKMLLSPVYYIPQARANLLSGKSAAKRGWTMVLGPGEGKIYKGENVLTFSGDSNLWTVPVSRMRPQLLSPPVAFIADTPQIQPKSKLGEEHQRLGHPGRPKLLELAKKGELVYSYEELMKDGFKLTDCGTCQSYKAVRVPTNQEVRRSKEDLDMIHSDLSGPFEASRRLNKYLLVIVDDHSGLVEAVGIQAKSDAFAKLKETVILWERRLGRSVKVIRTDGDTVFCDGAAPKWYAELGILHQISPRYTPELNGKSERTIRTVKDGIRAMVDSSGLGQGYWDYAAQYHAVISNKITTDDKGKTPWEKLTSRHPNVKSIRRFGEFAYVQIPQEVRRKSTFEQNNADLCRILGQRPNMSGWIVKLEKDGSIVNSKDVKRLTGDNTQSPTNQVAEGKSVGESEDYGGGGGGSMDTRGYGADIGISARRVSLIPVVDRNVIQNEVTNAGIRHESTHAQSTSDPASPSPFPPPIPSPTSQQNNERSPDEEREGQARIIGAVDNTFARNVSLTPYDDNGLSQNVPSRAVPNQKQPQFPPAQSSSITLPTARVQSTPLTPLQIERLEPRQRSGFDEATEKYVDQSGAVMTEELRKMLKARYEEDRGRMPEDEVQLFRRWKNYGLESSAPAKATVEPEEQGESGRGKRESKPTVRYGDKARDAFLPSEFAMSADINDDDPKSYRSAMKGQDGAKWKIAAEKELENLKKKKTWIVAKLPEGKHVIGSKWIFKTKRDADGEVVKHKGRVVAQGFSQQPGVDYENTFAPVGLTVSLRIILDESAVHGLIIHQADVEGAYLNARVKEEIYMKPPDGVAVPKGMVLRLLGSLYGIKQAGYNWWEELGNGLKAEDFNPLDSDWGVYRRIRNGSMMLILVYVDDMLFSAKTREEIMDVIGALRKRWDMTEMGEVQSILGLKVTRDWVQGKIWLSQPAYVDKIVESFPIISDRSYLTPLGASIESTDTTSYELTPYRQLIGSLGWLGGSTRPDISYAVGVLARACANPTEGHFQMAMRLLAYVKNTRELGIELGGKGKAPLEGWIDADFAGCQETRKSTSGMVFKLHNSPISWASVRQSMVATSTTEAEYIAVSSGGREVVHLRRLLGEMGDHQRNPTLIHCDSNSAIAITESPKSHQRTKHYDVKHHWIRQEVQRGTIHLEYIKTDEQQADMFTKSLPRNRHIENTNDIGMSYPGGAKLGNVRVFGKNVSFAEGTKG